jgi:hypothetical protein
MTFRILNGNGDEVQVYDMTSVEAAKAAQLHFYELVKSGKMMIAVPPSGDKFISSEFDPAVKEYIVGMRLAGG